MGSCLGADKLSDPFVHGVVPGVGTRCGAADREPGAFETGHVLAFVPLRAGESEERRDIGAAYVRTDVWLSRVRTDAL